MSSSSRAENGRAGTSGGPGGRPDALATSDYDALATSDYETEESDDGGRKAGQQPTSDEVEAGRNVGG